MEWWAEEQFNCERNRSERKREEGKDVLTLTMKKLNESAIEKTAAEIEMRKWQAQGRCTNDEMKECEGVESNMENMSHFQSNPQNEHSTNENSMGSHD